MHVLIIPDGNRRWAKKLWVRILAWMRRKELTYGHQQGAENLWKIIQEALRLEISYVTIWACTPNNLTQRSQEEVAVLHEVLEEAFNSLVESEEVHSNKVRVRAVGRWRDSSFCPSSLQAAIEKCMLATSTYDAFLLTILLAYSGVDERRDTEDRIRKDKNGPPVIDEQYEKSMSWIGNIPDVDLIIRTGIKGDPHNSEAVMPFHTANSQYYFTSTFWPDFTAEEFCQAIEDFKRRPRRYGR